MGPSVVSQTFCRMDVLPVTLQAGTCLREQPIGDPPEEGAAHIRAKHSEYLWQTLEVQGRGGSFGFLRTATVSHCTTCDVIPRWYRMA